MTDVHVVGAVLFEQTLEGPARCLAAQRRAGGAEGLRWEFPGGKVEPDEGAEAALVREIQEELGVVIRVGEHLGRGTALHGARRIVLDLYAATLEGGALERREHELLRWVTAEQMDELDWATADRFVLARVKQRLEEGRAHESRGSGGTGRSRVT